MVASRFDYGVRPFLHRNPTLRRCNGVKTERWTYYTTKTY